jgi:hypothetical protein
MVLYYTKVKRVVVFEANVTKMLRTTVLSSIFLSILNTVLMYLYSVRSQR